jgi:signal peptide peptidase SppA
MVEKPTPAAATSAPQSQTGSTNGTGSVNNASSSAPPVGILARRFPGLHGRYERARSSRFGRISSTIWTRRRPILLTLAVSYGVINYALVKRDAYIRDHIHPDSWLVMKVYPGAIVECKSQPSIARLLQTPTPGEDLPRQMDLFETLRAIKWARDDPRIKGLFADFSGLHIPSSVAPESLGLAQIEELVEAIHEFKIIKKQQRQLVAQQKEQIEQARIEASPNDKEPKEDAEKLEIEAFMKGVEDDSANVKETVAKKAEALTGKHSKIDKVEENKPQVDEPVTIAWADTFDSQGSYLLASVFEKLYVQPSGSIPLMGTRMEIPFFKRTLDWLGIKVHAEARKDYKSMVSSFIQNDELPPAQLEDESRLLGELSRSIAHGVGVNRYPDMEHESAADKVMQMFKEGPFTAKEAEAKGLITAAKYKREIIKELGEEPKLRSLSSYSRVTNTLLERKLNEDERLNVAIVYLLGGISNAPGEFAASQAIKGLREAGEDEDVTSIVLRINSGGGDVGASDSLWDAVKRVQEEYKKPVIASFGNISASGGYYAAAGADAIFACESTVTGSIGVASLRPTVTKKFFDRIGLSMQTIFSGSNMLSLFHEPDQENRRRHAKNTDDTYEEFLEKVCTGRSISKDVVEELAGGRVWTGLAAWVRCNPVTDSDDEKGIAQQQPSSTEKTDEKVGASKSDTQSGSETQDQEEQDLENALTAVPPIKIVNLHNDWKAVNVAKEGEMKTYRIESVPFSEDSKQNENVMGASTTASATQKEEEAEESKVMQAIHDAIENVVGDDNLDDESRLAKAAHEEAEKTNGHHKDDAEGAVAQSKEPELGPYGRGLIDQIGGIWEASHYALSLSVQREIDRLVQEEGMTLEQASENVFPGAKRAISEDGVMALATDIRLVRYPKEKTFYERVAEMRKKGDEPQLSTFFPSVANLGYQVREYISDMAVQLFVRSWSDPQFIQKIQSAMEQQQKIKLERQHHIQF